MNFFKSIFSKKQAKNITYKDFWDWFESQQKIFFNVVKQQSNIEKEFLNKLSPKLAEVRDGFFFLAGMFDDNTAELIITADGEIKNIVFAEELVEAAPQITGWKITALKPALDINNVNINMAGHSFNGDNLSFYSNDLPGYPDEIDITLIHPDFNEDNKTTITNGVYIFLDNYLGELNFATSIDNLSVIGTNTAEKELVPISKLKDFLIWRQKEFIEKYHNTRRDTENDEYATLTAELKDGHKLFAIVNTEVLNWDGKASHPWILTVDIKYKSTNNGMPDEATYQLLQDIEDEILLELKDVTGYINIGRQTVNGSRQFYFACREFRYPSKVLSNIRLEFSDKIQISYEIYKDKYWQSFERFNQK